MEETKENISLEEIWRLFKETDRRFKETERLLSERFNESERLLTEKFQETDRRFQETDRLLTEKFKETDRLIKETRKTIGELGGRLGQFVEDMVKPAALKLFQEKGLKVYRVIHNLEAFYEDRGMEIDLLVIDGADAVAIECKSAPSVEDVNEHMERLSRFKEFWPEYKNLNLYGAIAGMVVSDAASKYAYRQGLYVLAQNGETMEIRNDDKFKPKSW